MSGSEMDYLPSRLRWTLADLRERLNGGTDEPLDNIELTDDHKWFLDHMDKVVIALVRFDYYLESGTTDTTDSERAIQELKQHALTKPVPVALGDPYGHS